MGLKDELAAVTFFVGVAALVVFLVGVATFLSGLLPLALGSLVPPSLGGGGIVASGSSMVFFGAFATTAGLVGLLVVWAAITSGYFDRAVEAPDVRESATGEPGTDEPADAT